MNPVLDAARPHLRGLQGYIPGKQPADAGWVKLNTNEFPFAPPPEVLSAIRDEFSKLAAYPNPTSWPLREAIAEKYGLHPQQVIVGNGSDDILNLLVRAFGSEGQSVAECQPSYSLYPVLTAIANGELHSFPIGEQVALPVAEIAALQPHLTFITHPNAPTGVGFSIAELDALVSRVRGLVVFDEAYGEFAECSAISLLQQYPNAMVTRSFSKGYGLAGLRVGYGLGEPGLIQMLDAIRDSYNVNRLSQAGAMAALKCPEWYGEKVREIRSIRDWVRDQLLAAGWEVFPSQTNFLFGRPPGDGSASTAKALYDFLLERKILIRHFPKDPLTDSWLRVSIGSRDQMNQFLEATAKWNHPDV